MIKEHLIRINKQLEIVWPIYWCDVSLVTFSFVLAILFRLDAQVLDLNILSIVRYVIIFSLVAMSVCLWCQTYKPLWGAPFEMGMLCLAVGGSYFLFYPLFIVLKESGLSFLSLINGFFMGFLFLLFPRIVLLYRDKKSIKADPLIIIGQLQTLKDYFIWMQVAGYPVQAAVALDYQGPDRKLGSIPLTTLGRCPKGKKIAILEDYIAEKDLRFLQDMIESHKMQVVSVQKYFYVDEL